MGNPIPASRQSIIVLGLGIAGSSIAATLAERGHCVTAIEQYAPLHDRGSSHGDTRIYRRVPHEGAAYAELAAISLDGWRRWNQLAGENLYIPCGGIDAGPSDSPMVAAAESLCRLYGQSFELLTAAELNRRHPQFGLPASWSAVYQPASGVVRPDATRLFLQRQAQSHGAWLLHHTAVTAIDSTANGVTVHTASASHTADALIVSAGSWLPQLFPELNLPLTPERRVMAWFQSASQSPLIQATGPNAMPVFILDADGGWYGMPTPDGRLKIGHDKHLRQPVDPTQPVPEPNAEDATLLSACIRSYFPSFDPEPAAMKSCIYTLTPDHHFLIDRHPAHANILLFSCCSGHGFKFAPAYGEIAAYLTADENPSIHLPDLSQFTLSRHASPITRFSH